MSMTLPNGSQLAIATMSALKVVSDISNATAPAVSAVGHGILAKAPFLLASGWSRLNGRVFRAGTVQPDSFTIDGVSTLDEEKYPDGGGLGSLHGVASWTELTQQLEVTMSGGDPSYWSYSFLEDPDGQEMQMPTGKSAMAITVSLGDDPTLPWYDVLSQADEDKSVRVLRVRLPSGGVIYYPIRTTFNKTPRLVKNQGMAVTAAFPLAGGVTRYAAA